MRSSTHWLTTARGSLTQVTSATGTGRIGLWVNRPRSRPKHHRQQAVPPLRSRDAVFGLIHEHRLVA
jgi:hypothetical protein